MYLCKKELLIFVFGNHAMGSLRNIDFGVLWASWGGSRKAPGSGSRFPELILPEPRHCSGFKRLRARGFEGFGV